MNKKIKSKIKSSRHLHKNLIIDGFIVGIVAGAFSILYRVMYYNGTNWEGADAIDSISKIKGTDIVNHINNAETDTTINNNRLIPVVPSVIPL